MSKGFWKNHKVSYSGLHWWIRKHFGSPKFCEHCKTSEAKRYNWANISGKYLRDRADWKRLCYHCHLIFDKRYGETHGRAVLTAQEALTIRMRYRIEKISIRKLADEYGVSKSTIGALLKYKNWRLLKENVCLSSELNGVK